MQDIAEHLTTIYLKRCDRGKRCLYEGSTPADGFPNTWVCPPFHSSLLHINMTLHSLKVTNLVISFQHVFYILQNGASYCTSELTVLKNSEIHTSDRGYDYEGNQVSF